MIKDISIAVVGSINLDIVATVAEFPLPGETVTNASVHRFPGGKGANQALAAHRLGASVFMVGCVGNDAVAEEALSSLKTEGVDLSYCQSLNGVSTGLALIVVNEAGENQIVVAPGANAAFVSKQLSIPKTDAIIAQLEVPQETILQATANSSCFFCLNAAPAKPVSAALMARADLLVVNETEAQVLGDSLNGYQGMLAKTFGSKGAKLYKDGKEIASAKPPAINAIDTTGAGDAFTAAITVGLVSGLSAHEALQRACITGALTATKMGAQSSPLLKELLANTGQQELTSP